MKYWIMRKLHGNQLQKHTLLLYQYYKNMPVKMYSNVSCLPCILFKIIVVFSHKEWNITRMLLFYLYKSFPMHCITKSIKLISITIISLTHEGSWPPRTSNKSMLWEHFWCKIMPIVLTQIKTNSTKCTKFMTNRLISRNSVLNSPFL